MKTIKLLAILFISSLTFTACSGNDDDHSGDDHSEEELITTVTYTLTGPNTVVMTFTDLDGDGGAAPTITVSGDLVANTSYTGSLVLLNETESPAENITAEISAEADEHEFFFTNTLGLIISKTDVDSGNNPLGLSTTVDTGSAGTGSLTVVLKHEPKKPNNGTVADAGGKTDLEVTFDVTVQ